MDEFMGLVSIAAFIIAIVAVSKNSRLQGRLTQLTLDLRKLATEVADLRANAGSAAIPPVAEPVAAAAPIEAVAATDPVPAGEAIPLPQEPVAQPETPPHVPPPPPPRDMEQALASRWFVWIGGAAIAIGGLLFVKYAYDNHLISPTLQIVLGMLFGAALVAAGELLRRGRDVGGQPDYVPAALSAAGVVTMFGSIYAAYALYELVAPGTAFIGLAAVAIGALLLSRRQGPLIAALGLIGSYGTPLLVPSEHPSAWSFFPYLLVILAASFAVLRGRTWWWLGYAAILGSAGWTALWLTGGPFVPDDTLPIGLFLHALGLIAFFGLTGTAGADDASGWVWHKPTPPLLLGLAGLAAEGLLLVALAQRTQHGSLALVLFFVAVAEALAIAWRRPGLSPIALAAGVLTAILLAVWSDVAIHEWAMDERGMWTTVLGGEARRFLNMTLAAGAVLSIVGAAGARLREPPLAWSILASGAAVLFVTGAWARVGDLLSPAAWAVIAAAFAALLLVTARYGRARNADSLHALASGLLATGTALMVLFGLFRLLDHVWLTMAIAVLALFFAALASPLQLRLTGAIAAALGTLTAVRLFVSRELWTDQRDLPLGPHWPLYGYGVPVILLLAASRTLRRSGVERSAVALEGISLGLAISLVALELRVLIAGGVTYDEPQFLEMAAHILTWLGAAYGLMHRQRVFSSVIAVWGARILLAGACVAIVLFSLVTLNPVVTEEPVPGNLVFNALLLAYLAPVVLLGLIGRRLETIGWQRARPALGLLALVLAFVYLTLETKRFFQGHLMQVDALSPAESYAYSAVWLVFALALFVAGLRLGRQYIRYAGLGVMVVTVLKVFLWDMASLEGLWRIASVIGLGFCLVGIGWLYRRYVQAPRPRLQPQPGAT